MSNADTQLQPVPTDDKPNEFTASGGSPPTVAVPPGLMEELAEILADALVADVERDRTHLDSCQS